MAKPHWAFIHPFQLRIRRGIESYVWALTRALADTGVDIDILTWQGPLKSPSLSSAPVTLRTVPRVRYYQQIVAMPFYVLQLLFNRYDHVFVNFAGYGEGPSLRLLGAIKNVPFSVVFHFPPTLVPHRYREFERWRFQRDATHFIAVSDHVASQVSEWSHRKCSVISHGVDTKNFRPDKEKRERTRASLGISPDAHLLVTAAALEERKGIHFVIEALPAVLKTFPSTCYLILGEGRYRKELEALISKLGLQRHVRFKGEVDDVENYLCAADLGLLLSREEALGIAVLEYAASSLPVITSQEPPFDQFVNNSWGITADKTNSRQLSEMIKSLLADPARRATMGSAGRAWVEINYSWQQVATDYRDLIH
jgi:glycosyltransferase involved in cell wall biosynthesis